MSISTEDIEAFPYRVIVRRCPDCREKSIGIGPLGEWDIKSLLEFVGKSDAFLCSVNAQSDRTFPPLLEPVASKQYQIVRKGKIVLHVSAANLAANLSDITNLALHKQTAKVPAAVADVINRSCIVLLVAAWEAYVEDILQEGYAWVLRHHESSRTMPNVGFNLEYRKKTQALRKELAKLHNPDTGRIEPMFSKYLGLNQISSQWTWNAMTSDIAIKKLNELIRYRGAIAHRVRANGGVILPDVSQYIAFVCDLVTVTHQAVFDHLLSITRDSTSKKYWTEAPIITHSIKRALREPKADF
ncbi:MAG: HEPN domain-containing protein [Verrucomicrobiota bacterium]